MKLDTSLIQDEKYLIDSLVIEAKQKGLLEETFGVPLSRQENDQLINNNNFQKSKNYNNKGNKINMSNIYNNKKMNNINSLIPNNQNNKNVNEIHYAYDPNKHKAYYESLNNKMKKSIDSNASNKSNYIKNSFQRESEIHRINFINNQINNDKYNNYKNRNNKEEYSNINFQNNLLSSTDTTGPYRYLRKNRKDEPNLIDLLMDK